MTAIVSAVIFSRDRAMQLDATINSWEKCVFARGDYVWKKTVIYKDTTERHRNQYRQLMSEYPSWNFFHEGIFTEDLRNAFSGSTFWFPMVDDCVFLAQVDIGPALQQLTLNGRLMGLSLRLGRNTVHCYPTDKPQRVPDFSSQLIGGMWTYGWGGQDGDFGYPMEVSSSVYRTSDVHDAIYGGGYSQPNELESSLYQGTVKTRPEMLCFDRSVATCVPTNIVNERCPNNRAIAGGKTAEELADEFDRGYRIDCSSFYGRISNACHMDWPLQLVNKRG